MDKKKISAINLTFAIDGIDTIDGQIKGNSNISRTSPDVQRVFPKCRQANNGYSHIINFSSEEIIL